MAAAGRRSGAAWMAGLLWAAAGLSAGYWMLRVTGQGPWVPLQGMAASVPVVEVSGVARALGAFDVPENPQAAPVVKPRLQLLGVITQGRFVGAALIAMDGEPPRPQRIGAVVADGLVLQSVGRRTVRLGETLNGPTTLELALPVETAADGGLPAQ